MATSMTGYGRGEASEEGRRILVEIKTVNNRYCDQQIRMPRVLAALESRTREEISRQVARGKVDVFINYEDTRAEAYKVSCDVGLARAYANALRELAQAASVPFDCSAGSISRFSDVLRVEPARPDPEDTWCLLETALKDALAELARMRALEGDRLAQDIRQRSRLLLDWHREIADRAPSVIIEYKEKLAARIEELLGEKAAALFDEQRLAAEIAVFADKFSIDEELVRLESHLRQLADLLDFPEPIGKKLDFLVQEINREINTIGSKANDLELTRRVIAMKSESEKIREQIQNLE